MKNRDLVDVREAGRLSGLNPSTIYRIAREGRLRSFRVLGRALRFERSDLLALARERTVEPKSSDTDKADSFTGKHE